MNIAIIDQDTGRELWRAVDCARHCQITTDTWHGYVRKQMPPEAVAHLDGRTPLWDASAVKDWHASRSRTPQS